MKYFSVSKGFSIIEGMVVVAVLVVIGALGVVYYNNATKPVATVTPAVSAPATPSRSDIKAAAVASVPTISSVKDLDSVSTDLNNIDINSDIEASSLEAQTSGF